MVITRLVIDIDEIRHGWRWLLALGIVMIVAGSIALVIMPAATLGTILVLGWLLVFSGVIEAIHAFRVRRWTVFSCI